MTVDALPIGLPPILNIPPKLYPLITEFDKYKYFVIEGGRGSAKSQSVCRLLLCLADRQRLRIVCGRETQNTIEESVYTILKDIIFENNLYFEVQKSRIFQRETKADFLFKGFREQGLISIKGLEGTDILYIDEAQSITKPTLDVIIPTIRKDKSKIIFTMNRFLRNDAVFETLVGRKDCLHIRINYDDNPHCPHTLKVEAEECRVRSEKDYKHIWMGEPLDKDEDYLFNFAKLDKAQNIAFYGDAFEGQSVMSVDLAGGGGDQCVASLLKRKTATQWELAEQRSWSDADTDASIGRVVAFNSLWLPTCAIVDKGGLGLPMFCTLSKSIPTLIGFDGAGSSNLANAVNQRADGYLTLKEFIDSEWLQIKGKEVIRQLESIKIKRRANGQILIIEKKLIKDECGRSPDDADSLMMGVYAIRYFLGKIPNNNQASQNIRRVNIRGDRK